MIWDKPIHESRSIKDWLDNTDTGFQPKIIELIAKCAPIELVKTPYMIAKDIPIFNIDSMRDIKQVASIVKAFSNYADIAMWCDGTKFPRNPGREVAMCNWTETDIFTSYKTADVLIISNIPDNTSEAICRNHRAELDKIINSRQQRHRNITIVIGPNHDTLPSIIQYKQLEDALKS
jgi:hypothetical protein